VLWRNLLGIPTFRLMQFWGTYRGFAQWGPVTSHLKLTFCYPNGLVRTRSGITKPELGHRVGYAGMSSEGRVGRDH
jgi:hypothetical protein